MEHKDLLIKLSDILSNDYSTSKDWVQSDLVNRVLWLKLMYESKNEEIEHWLQEIERRDRIIEQQAAEIERLQIREHRMIEYMRDVKNFAFTINEVANNAIEEAEVQE